jgi:leucyl-tRNA synthetase
MERIHNKVELKFRRRELRKNATPQERRLWQYLRNRRLGYKFRRQHSIGYYIADFYCSERGLIIELDGEIHDETKEYDLERDCKLENYDFTVLRISNSAVDRNIHNVISKIKEILGNPLSGNGEGAESSRRVR